MRELEQLLRRLIEFGLLTEDEETLVNKSLLNIETKLTPKTAYIEFMEEFSSIRKAKHKPTLESRRLFYENESLFTNTDRLTALKNAMTETWIKERLTILTPEWILEAKNLSKYMNYAAPNSQPNDAAGKQPARQSVA